MNPMWRQRMGRMPRAWRLAWLAVAALAGAASGPVELPLQASLPATASLRALLPAADAARHLADPRCVPGASDPGCAAAPR